MRRKRARSARDWGLIKQLCVAWKQQLMEPAREGQVSGNYWQVLSVEGVHECIAVTVAGDADEIGCVISCVFFITVALHVFVVFRV